MLKEMLNHLAGKPLLIEPRAIRALAARLVAVPLQLDAAQSESFGRWQAARVERRAYQMTGSTAVIPIRGLIMKSVPPLLEWWGEILGWEFTSTDRARDAIAQAVEDDAVSAIALDIDSPGGTVDGVQALADDAYAARELKTLSADVDGMMASAALWIGAQADTIRADRTSEIGSIGVFGVVTDWSSMYEEAGVKVHVISNAPGKGYARGAPVSEESLGNLQSIVDGLTNEFIDALARGRQMDRGKVAELATGEVWLGEEARRRGLIDEVGPDARAITTDGRQAHGATTMSKTTEERLAALEAENAALKADAEKARAEAEAARALSEAAKENEREALVSQYKDRVPPSARDAVLRFGAACDSAAEFEGYLRSLPVSTRAEPIGDSGGDQMDPGRARVGARGMTAAQRKICRVFGFKSWDRVERLGSRGTAIKSDNTLVLADGSWVPPDEFQSFADGKTLAIPAEDFGLV